MTAHRIICKLGQMETDFSEKYLGSVLGCSNFSIKTSAAMYFCTRYVGSAQSDRKEGNQRQTNLSSEISSRTKTGANLKPQPSEPSFLWLQSFSPGRLWTNILVITGFMQYKEVRKGNWNTKIIGSASIFTSLISMCTEWRPRSPN